MFLFLIFGLIFSLFATVTTTVCEYHLMAVDKVPSTNLTISDVTIELTPQTVKNILNCPAGTTATADNNFISILGADSLFNVTKQVRYTDTIRKAQTQCLSLL